MNNIGHGRMIIFSNKSISMCFEQKQKKKKERGDIVTCMFTGNNH